MMDPDLGYLGPHPFWHWHFVLCPCLIRPAVRRILREELSRHDKSQWPVC